MSLQFHSGEEGLVRFLESRWCSVYGGSPKKLVLILAKEWQSIRIDELSIKSEGKQAMFLPSMNF